MKKQRLSLRILVGIAVPAALLLGAAFFLRFGSPPCIFHALTGIYCPGCGAGRALRALTEEATGVAASGRWVYGV